MVSRLFSLLLALVLTAMGGCSRHTSSLTGKASLEGTGDWPVLANHVADRINQELIRQHYLQASLYIGHSTKASGSGEAGGFPFDTAFNDLLTSNLVQFGVHTVNRPEQAQLVVDYTIQTVYHPAATNTWRWPKPGVLIALAAGVVVLENAPWELVAAATGVDMYRANHYETGQYQIIITTTVRDRERFVMRSSDIYFIDNADYWQYHQAPPATEIKLTGRHQPVPSTPGQKTTL